jgi:hypothetical protein
VRTIEKEAFRSVGEGFRVVTNSQVENPECYKISKTREFYQEVMDDVVLRERNLIN